MLIALFADIHANVAALEACLHHARGRRAARYVFLGDLVGYGPDPGRVIDVIASIEGAVVLKGNHDEAIEVEPKIRDINDAAYAVITWTRSVLSAEQRRFLANLPLTVREGDMFFVHASADRPQQWEYIQDAPSAARSMQAAGAPYVFSGHVHDQALYFKTPAGKTALFLPTSGSAVPVARRHGWQAFVGSCGQPRDGDPSAAYALFDDAAHTLTFFRIPYDHAATVRRIRDARMPMGEIFAERIARGS